MSRLTEDDIHDFHARLTAYVGRETGAQARAPGSGLAPTYSPRQSAVLLPSPEARKNNNKASKLRTRSSSKSTAESSKPSSQPSAKSSSTPATPSPGRRLRVRIKLPSSTAVPLPAPPAVPGPGQSTRSKSARQRHTTGEQPTALATTVGNGIVANGPVGNRRISSKSPAAKGVVRNGSIGNSADVGSIDKLDKSRQRRPATAKRARISDANVQYFHHESRAKESDSASGQPVQGPSSPKTRTRISDANIHYFHLESRVRESDSASGHDVQMSPVSDGRPSPPTPRTDPGAQHSVSTSRDGPARPLPRLPTAASQHSASTARRAPRTRSKTSHTRASETRSNTSTTSPASLANGQIRLLGPTEGPRSSLVPTVVLPILSPKLYTPPQSRKSSLHAPPLRRQSSLSEAEVFYFHQSHSRQEPSGSTPSDTGPGSEEGSDDDSEDNSDLEDSEGASDDQYGLSNHFAGGAASSRDSSDDPFAGLDGRVYRVSSADSTDGTDSSVSVTIAQQVHTPRLGQGAAALGDSGTTGTAISWRGVDGTADGGANAVNTEEGEAGEEGLEGDGDISRSSSAAVSDVLPSSPVTEFSFLMPSSPPQQALSSQPSSLRTASQSSIRNSGSIFKRWAESPLLGVKKRQRTGPRWAVDGAP